MLVYALRVQVDGATLGALFYLSLLYRVLMRSSDGAWRWLAQTRHILRVLLRFLLQSQNVLRHHAYHLAQVSMVATNALDALAQPEPAKRQHPEFCNAEDGQVKQRLHNFAIAHNILSASLSRWLHI